MAGLFKEFVKNPLIHASRLCTDSMYRKYYWLRTKYDKFPAHKQVNLNFDGLSLIVPDTPSFLFSLNEIFLTEIYKFESNSEKPVIIDMGGNIGLSSIFFKRLYPEAQLSVYEADPNIFEILSSNLNNNGFDDIAIYNFAIWDSNCTLSFKPDNADGGHISNEGAGVSIKAVDFTDVLKKFDKIDFLKMDIEGAENNLWDKFANELDKIDNLFVEYHSFKNSPQKLGDFLSILEAKNFRYNIENPHPGGMPSNSPDQVGDFDLQVNVWAKKIC